MQLSSLIGHTHEILTAILTTGKPADGLMDPFFRSHAYLGSRDRRFIAEQAYGLLRHLRRCQHDADYGVRDFQGAISTPDHLYLLLAVHLAGQSYDREQLDAALQTKIGDRGLSHFLHKFLPRIGTAPMPYTGAERIGIQYSFPNWMVRTLIDEYGEQEAELLCAALNEPAPLQLRVNTLKTDVARCRERLAAEGVDTMPTKLSPFGLTVSKRINIFSSAAFREGWFEVQDEGSQMLPLLIDPKPSVKLLDACAGAGGKTLEFSVLMDNRGEILASDVRQFRLEELRKRARRAGAHNIRVRAVDDLHDLAADWTGGFDVVLVDAPCSGLGTIRRNPGMKWTVTEQTVREIAEKQRSILQAASVLLAAGGVLAYATCTVLRSENEAQIEGFLAEHSDFERSPSPKAGEMRSRRPGEYVLLPHVHGTDGFFCALMRKTR